MARCGDCNKFVSLDTESDPDVDLNIDDEGTVSGTVHIVNNCSECGTELRTADFDIEVDHTDVFAEHKKNADSDHEGETPLEHSLEIKEDEIERTHRTQGKGRGQKTFYGAEVSYVITCSCKEKDPWTHKDTWSDEIQASSMDEC